MGAADTEIILLLNTSSLTPLNWGMFRLASDSEAWGGRDVKSPVCGSEGNCSSRASKKCMCVLYKHRYGPRYLEVHRSPGLQSSLSMHT